MHIRIGATYSDGESAMTLLVVGMDADTCMVEYPSGKRKLLGVGELRNWARYVFRNRGEGRNWDAVEWAVEHRRTA